MGDPTPPPRTILVVDDDTAVHHIVGRVLELKGYRVLTAAGGREALEQVGKAPVDLLLVDKHMPVMSGFEVVEAVRAVRPQVAVVMMTAFPDRAGLSALKLDGYLPKPFKRLSDITDTVEQALAAQARRALQVQLQETVRALKRS